MIAETGAMDTRNRRGEFGDSAHPQRAFATGADVASVAAAGERIAGALELSGSHTARGSPLFEDPPSSSGSTCADDSPSAASESASITQSPARSGAAVDTAPEIFSGS